MQKMHAEARLNLFFCMYTIYVGHSSIGVANERHNLYVFSNKIYCYVFQLEVGID